MSVAAIQACRVKASLFGSCGGDAMAQCQYCARAFCRRHGVVLEDGQQVCSRKACVAKRRDLDLHMVYKEAVRLRNEHDACGIEACEAELGAQCVRCKGLFCAGHVQKRQETVLENRVRVARMSTLCRHCWARRPIWLRT